MVDDLCLRLHLLLQLTDRLLEALHLSLEPLNIVLLAGSERKMGRTQDERPDRDEGGDPPKAGRGEERCYQQNQEEDGHGGGCNGGPRRQVNDECEVETDGDREGAEGHGQEEHALHAVGKEPGSDRRGHQKGKDQQDPHRPDGGSDGDP